MNWRVLLDLGGMSPVDIIMALNPDFDREQAPKQLKQAQEEIRLFFDEPTLLSLSNIFPRPSGVKGVVDGPVE